LKSIKNSIIGFLVSFIGSIPLGYLNIIGFEIYKKTNLIQLVNYLLGVVFIEAIVIYATLYFAHKLVVNKKLNQFLSLFSIAFLLFLTYYFYSSNNDTKAETSSFNYFLQFPTLITGILLSSLNFAQVPFWLSWNVYLVNEKYLYEGKKLKIFYLLGTILGTFFGMLLLILAIVRFSNTGIVNKNFFSEHLWIIFLGLSIFQIIQWLRKKK
jgi:hypothetical protein